MKSNFVFAIIISLSFQAFGQTPIDVAESTLKVGGLGDEVFYYGFAEGDQLIFNFEELKGKELKELEIIELPSSSKFMDYKTKKIQNKIINVNRTGIYKFRFANSAISGRICKFKIQRIPASEATKTLIQMFIGVQFMIQRSEMCKKDILLKRSIKQLKSYLNPSII
jgi:hypothetical protein